MSHVQILPRPSLLPDMRTALNRRASVFGPIEIEEVRASPRGLRAVIGASLRRLADLLEPIEARR